MKAGGVQIQQQFFPDGGFVLHKIGGNTSAWYDAAGNLLDAEYRDARGVTRRVKPSTASGSKWSYLKVVGKAWTPVRKNPTTRGAAQRRASVDGGRTRYIRRPSQITKKKPTKRLRKRRGKNYDRPTKGRFPNPSRKGFKICIRKGNGPKMHYDGEKFSQRPHPRTYPTQAAAMKEGRFLLTKFRVLKKYRVTVEPNF